MRIEEAIILVAFRLMGSCDDKLFAAFVYFILYHPSESTLGGDSALRLLDLAQPPPSPSVFHLRLLWKEKAQLWLPRHKTRIPTLTSVISNVEINIQGDSIVERTRGTGSLHEIGLCSPCSWPSSCTISPTKHYQSGAKCKCLWNDFTL